MAMKLEMIADVGKFLKGLDSASDALNDVADDLTGLAKDSDRAATKAGDAIGDEFKSGAKTAGKALDGVGKDLAGTGDQAQAMDAKVGQAFKSIAADAKKSGDTVGKESKDGFTRGSEAAETFKDEAKSNLSEVTSSFSGDMDSAVDLVQGTLGGLVADLGPAGLIGGAVAALGIGLAKAFAEGEAERVNELGDAVSALAGEIRAADGDLTKIDFPGRMQEWGLSIQDTREWWEVWQDKAKTGLEVIREKSDAAGVSFVGAFKGTKGTIGESQDALQEVNKALDEATSNVTRYSDAVSGMEWNDPADQKKIDALRELKKKYEENIDTQTRAKENSEALAAAGVKTADAIQREADAAKKADDALTGMAQAMSEAAGNAISADQAQLDYTEELKASADAVKINGKTLDENTVAGRANRQTLIDLAQSSNSLIQAQVDQGGSTADVTAKAEAARQAFINQAIAAGATADEAANLATRYGLIPKNVETYVKAHDVEKTKGEIDGVANPRTATVNVKTGEDHVTPYINSLNGKSIFMNIVGRGGNPALP